MPDPRRLPKPFWRLMKAPRVWYALGLGPLMGRVVLLLTTTGRKSGLARTTPLQYEEVDGLFYVGSARGVEADWYKNLVADPRVEVRVGARRFKGLAEPVTNPTHIADFLELRLERRPRMVGAMLQMEGLPPQPERAHLEELASKIALVVLRPLEETE